MVNNGVEICIHIIYIILYSDWINTVWCKFVHNHVHVSIPWIRAAPKRHGHPLGRLRADYVSSFGRGQPAISLDWTAGRAGGRGQMPHERGDGQVHAQWNTLRVIAASHIQSVCKYLCFHSTIQQLCHRGNGVDGAVLHWIPCLPIFQQLDAPRFTSWCRRTDHHVFFADR